MKYLAILMISFVAFSCNVVQWNQKRLSKKYERKGLTEKYFRNDDHTVKYWEGGEGETVVLIHGFGGDGQMTWNQTIQDLVKDYHVVVPDLLWFGKSTSKQEPNLDAQIDAMTSLFDHCGIKSCKLVGISYGGFVSLGIVQAKPELVSDLCIVDSPGMTYDVSLLDTLCHDVGVNEVQDIFVIKEPKNVLRLFNLASYKKKRIPKGILRQTHELYFDLNYDEQYQLLETLPQERERFIDDKDFKVPPTTIIWGEDDAIFPLSEGEKLAKALDAELYVVPKAGHAVNLDNFKDFQRYLRDFLKN